MTSVIKPLPQFLTLILGWGRGKGGGPAAVLLTPLGAVAWLQ